MGIAMIGDAALVLGISSAIVSLSGASIAGLTAWYGAKRKAEVDDKVNEQVHEATMVEMPWSRCAADSVVTFSSASIWNRYSLPARRAGSPLHVSPAPRTTNGTSAWRSSWAMARTTLRLRSSNAPAQPTQ